MVPACGVVTMTTDFGLNDSYVGTMKGVILKIFPEARIVDISHQINPQDILEATLVLDSAYRYFPAGSVHLVVVDPGVGGGRRPMVISTDHHAFVGPDNGTFTRVLESEPGAEAFEIRDSSYMLPNISDTFHGRDIFGPVAAHLASEVEARWFGKWIEDFVRLPIPQLRGAPGALMGEVVYVDRFGNLVTNIDLQSFYTLVKGKRYRITAGAESLESISRCYADGQPGQLLALFGCQQTLELSVNKGSAANKLGKGRGLQVVVQAS